MKTKNRTILLLVFVFSGIITSCESYLDTMPDQRAELNSVKKVKDLLMSAYSTASSIQMEELLLGGNDRHKPGYTKISVGRML